MGSGYELTDHGNIVPPARRHEVNAAGMAKPVNSLPAGQINTNTTRQCWHPALAGILQLGLNEGQASEGNHLCPSAKKESLQC
jgi:hypothetical protein